MATTHGMTRTAEYRAWAEMKQRCFNPRREKFADYGARGITVDSAWLSFEGFFRDMGLMPGRGYTVERIDNNRGYGPDNCRWATRQEQATNKRNTIRIEVDGVTKHASEWARLTGIPLATICYRVRHKLPVADRIREKLCKNS